MVPKGSNIPPGHMGPRSPGMSSRTNFIRDFSVKSLIKIGPPNFYQIKCSLNSTFGAFWTPFFGT